jgi:hypothetical protein
VLFRRRSKDDDEVTTSLLRRGVYRISDIEDEEIKKFKGAGMVYSFWGAVKYTFVLTLLLWWLPIFGQMIAGYVGGRRAGSPIKAIVAAIVPVVVIFTIMYLFSNGVLPSQINGFTINPEQLFTNLGAGVPYIEPYLQFVGLYVQSFMGVIQSINLLKLDNYIVLVAFAYIGGVLAQQTKRELEYVADHGGHKTQIVIGKDQSDDKTPLRLRALRYSKPQTEESELSFNEMQALDGDAEIIEEIEPQPIHTTKRRSMSQMAGEGAHNRNAIAERIKTMERDQRNVERRVKKRSTVASGLVSKSGKGGRQKSRAAEKEQKNSDGPEYI